MEGRNECIRKGLLKKVTARMLGTEACTTQHTARHKGYAGGDCKAVAQMQKMMAPALGGSHLPIQAENKGISIHAAGI